MGVLMYILLSGKVPFPGECNKEIIENVISGEYHFRHDAFSNVSDVGKDLINKLLVKDYEVRFSAKEAYEHPWIQMAEKHAQFKIADDVYDNMKEFVDASKFKKTALTYMAWKVPERQIEDLRNSFIKIDKNADGCIQADEFWAALEFQNMKASEEEIRTLISILDTNQNGYIDYTEFLAGCLRSRIYLKEANLKQAFEYFDKDSSGSITIDELK